MVIVDCSNGDCNGLFIGNRKYCLKIIIIMQMCSVISLELE